MIIGGEVDNTTPQQQVYKNTNVDHRCETVSQKVTGYIKPVYPILIGNSVKIYSTSVFASLPQHDKFLVKEKQKDPIIGSTRAKLVLKSCSMDIHTEESNLRYILNAI